MLGAGPRFRLPDDPTAHQENEKIQSSTRRTVGPVGLDRQNADSGSVSNIVQKAAEVSEGFGQF